VPRIKPGDIFETSVLGSFAYLQFVKSHEDFGDLVRVFTTLHEERMADVENIPRDPSFRVFYSVRRALKPPPLIKPTGNVALRDKDRQPLIMRTGGAEGPWQIHEECRPTRTVHSLSEADANLPRSFPIVSHSWLLHYILKANGISVPTSALSVPTATKVANDEIMFFFYFDEQSDAIAAIAHLGTIDILRKFRAELVRDTSRWSLTLIGKMPGFDESVMSSMESVAAKFDGVFDGFEEPIMR